MKPRPHQASKNGGTHRTWAVHLAVPVLWLAAFAVARVLEHAPHASLWFPPAAVTVASVLVLGARALPWIVASCSAATVVTDRVYGGDASGGVLLLASLAFSFTHATGFGLAAGAVRRWGRAENGAPTLATVAGFLGATALGAAFAALAGSHLLAAVGLISGTPTAGLVVAWWIGDYVAAVTLMPVFTALLLALAGPGALGTPAWLGRMPHPPSAPAPTTALVAFAVVTLGVLGIARAHHEQSILLALLVVPLMLQLWITYTAPRRYTIASVTVFSLLTVGASNLSDPGAALVLQCAALSLAANAYLGLSVPALIADNARLRDQLSRDRLTGAMSRASFEDRSRAAAHAAATTGHGFSLVLFDLNGLKGVNDRLGHLAGDAVLVSVVERCRTCLAVDDAIARLGGDEFVMLLPGRDEASARRIIDAIREALRQLAVEGVREVVSASFGIATWQPGDSAEAMLARADAAMYAEKKNARQRGERRSVERDQPVG